jgi:DNA polymerase, archaea type
LYSPLLKKVTFTRVYERCRNIFDGESTTTGPKEKRQRGYIFTKKTIEQLEHQFNAPTEIKILNNDTNISNGNNNSVQNAQVKGVTGAQQNAFPEYVNDVTPNNTTPRNKDSFSISLDDSIINNNNIIEYKIHNPEPNRTDSSVTTIHSSALIEPNAVHLFTNSRIEGILGTYVSWDLEWNAHGQITAAAFIDNQDNQVVYLLEDFNYSERVLIQAIISKLLDYRTSIGWYTTGASGYQDGSDSDLMHLHKRCQENGLDSIVKIRQNGQPYLSGLTHIDLFAVFDKKIIKDAVYKGGYYNLSLNRVAKHILKEGKYKSLTGEAFNYLPIKEKRNYVLQDASLVMKLSKHDNYKVLDFMLAISELCEIDFERVCRTNLTTWWKCVYDKMLENQHCGFPTKQFDPSVKYAYKGGQVFDPKHGLYGNYIVVLDLKSLYPSIGILYNLSFDTINCDCCEFVPECRVKPEIIKECVVEQEYWICHKKDGALKTKLLVFREERFRQKDLGNDAKQQVLKILINGAYGVFGKDYFYYYDPRVAELITAYGRYTLLKMRELAQENGFEVIYGDTDSVFIHMDSEVRGPILNTVDNAKNIVGRFQKLCEERLGVEVELKRIYYKSIMSEGKKHYVGYGIDDKGKEVLDIVGMEGKKRNRPKFIQDIFNEIIDRAFKPATIDMSEVISITRSAMDKINSGILNPSELLRSEVLQLNPEDYKDQCCAIAKKGHALGLRKDDVVEWYDSDNKQHWSSDPSEISAKKYRQLLWNSLEEIFEQIGLPVQELASEFGVKVKKKKKGHKAEPPSGVAGQPTNLQNDTGGES